ncbi:MAG: TPM domain-containing protein [Thermoproteota archaeon]
MLVLILAAVATAAAAVGVAVASEPAFGQTATARGSRPAYIYDNANVISDSQERVIDSYLRRLDDATTNEIVIYTIPSFQGHGIKKDGVEIQDRDMLANYIFNEVSLDGLKGIGKKGKDNGVLVLMSLERDAGGGSLRIEVGRGLEGDITDGTAGEILDDYLVPARQQYEDTGSTGAFDDAFLGTVVALGERMGYKAPDDISVPAPIQYTGDETFDYVGIAVFVAFFIIIAVVSWKFRHRRGGRHGGPIFFPGGYRGGGGGFGGGGGGGGSGGGGAGR